MDEKKLDIEFIRYTKIIKPYVDELVDKEAVEVCHAWLEKLTNCTDRTQRNRYVLKLLFQIARGSLQEPFTKHPTSEDLDIIPEGADNYSDLEYLPLDQDTSPLAAGDKSSKAPDKKCKAITVSKENSTFSDVKLKRNRLINIKSNNSTIENRVKNLIIKLRHMKRENAILHQLLTVQEEHDKNCGDYISENCKETPSKFCSVFRCISDLRSNLIEPNDIFQSDQGQINKTKKKEMEWFESKQNLDLTKFKNENELEIIKNYETKIFELTKQHINSLDELRQYYENLYYQLKITYNAKVIEKDGIIKSKDEEIERLNKCVKELHTRTPLSNFSTHKIEQRLNKIERSTSKCLKKYQKKILKQRQKYIHDCALLLELLKQKSNVTDDVKVDDRSHPLANSFKKLEEKYKNIFTKVQAATLQRMIEDQLAMEALEKKISKMSFVCFKSSQMNNVHNKIKTKSEIKDPSPHESDEVIDPDEQKEPTN